MMVIKRSLGPDINYKELPMQKRIQIDQKIVAKKRKLIDKISKKILRKLKQKRVKELNNKTCEKHGRSGRLI